MTVAVHLFSKQTADIRPLSDSSRVLPATEHNTPFILTGKRVQQCLVFTAKCALKNYSKCGGVNNTFNVYVHTYVPTHLCVCVCVRVCVCV